MPNSLWSKKVQRIESLSSFKFAFSLNLATNDSIASIKYAKVWTIIAADISPKPFLNPKYTNLNNRFNS